MCQIIKIEERTDDQQATVCLYKEKEHYRGNVCFECFNGEI